MYPRDYPEALAENPGAVAMARQVRAAQGFDPLDPAVVHTAIQCYLKCRSRIRLWSTVLGIPLFFVILGVIVSAGGAGLGALGGGVALLVIGLALSAFPLHKVIRAYRTYQTQALPVVRGYEAVLGAAQPDRRSGDAAVRRWRRDKGLSRS